MATCIPIQEEAKETCREIQRLSLNNNHWRSRRVSEMKEKLLNRVCIQLDTETALDCSWRALGCSYNFLPLDLDEMGLAFKARKSPSRELFQHLRDKFPELTIQDLLNKLGEIKRIDIKQDIEKFMETASNEEELRRPGDGLDSTDACASPRVTEAHCRELSKKLKNNWMNLLREAKLSDEIDEIDASTNSLREKAYQALICWKESGTAATPKTLKDLEVLLRSIKRNDLADNLETYTSVPVQAIEFHNDGPIDVTMFTKLCAEIGTSWMWLMRYLDMPEHKIKTINEEQKSVEEKVYKGLCLWSEDRSGASKRMLATALFYADKKHLLETLESL